MKIRLELPENRAIIATSGRIFRRFEAAFSSEEDFLLISHQLKKSSYK
jgi:hypothetical protein